MEHRIQHGLLYEDFAVGQVFEHHWGRTFTAAESAMFSTLTLNHNPLYFNTEYARQLDHRDLVVNPLLVYNTTLGLSVEDLSEAGGPFLGVDEMRFPQPVYPGDTIYARSEVTDQRVSQSRPGWGIVEWRTEGYNQRGEVIIAFRRRNLSRRREQS